MAFVHGKNATFSLDNAAGTLVDLSDYVTDVTFDRSIDTAEVSVMGLDDKQYIAGMRGATMSINGPWETTVDSHMEGVLGHANTLTFNYSPDGTIVYSGECHLVSYNSSSPLSAAATWTSQIQITGAVSRA